MACIQKKKLLDGTISYRVQVKAKNQRTGKFEAKAITWKKPLELTETQAKKELQRIALELEEKFNKQLNGLLAVDNDITFIDYAERWLEKIKNTRSLNYYVKGRDCLKKFYKYFGNIKLNQITPVMVQGFLDDMMMKRYEKKSARLTGDLNQYLKSHCIKQVDALKKIGISKSILASANAGYCIRIENAEKICNALGLKYDDYFSTEVQSHAYAKETIMKLKRTLATILADAKRQRLVEHNFASRDYIAPIQGYKKEVKILNDKEAKILANYLHTEPNPRWKIALLTVLFMGLRRGELAGLEWKDIDYFNKTMTIARSVQDIIGFGLITKEPKTENSKRTISMPDKLIDYLKEYEVWWLNQKKYLGDRLGDTDRLFCTEDGTDISPGLFRVWLQKTLAKTNLPKVTLHSLRHTNITLQLVAGVDMKTVSARAGHSKASTTSDFYSHFIKNSDIHASEILNKIFE
ncbi:MAG: site-specific integrase [Clostridia bacterium]|nr:site-specific integrase [Clostridia bacterium]